MIKSITLEIEAGTEIDHAAYVAEPLCKRYNCHVRFDFNGIVCEVKPSEPYRRAVARYWKAINERGSNNA